MMKNVRLGQLLLIDARKKMEEDDLFREVDGLIPCIVTDYDLDEGRDSVTVMIPPNISGSVTSGLVVCTLADLVMQDEEGNVIDGDAGIGSDVWQLAANLGHLLRMGQELSDRIRSEGAEDSGLSPEEIVSQLASKVAAG
jgi:hypothetical protein